MEDIEDTKNSCWGKSPNIMDFSEAFGSIREILERFYNSVLIPLALTHNTFPVYLTLVIKGSPFFLSLLYN